MAQVGNNASLGGAVENRTFQPLSEKPLEAQPTRVDSEATDALGDVVKIGARRSSTTTTENGKLNGKSKRRAGSVSVRFPHSHPSKTNTLSLIEQRLQMDQRLASRLASGPSRHYNVRTIPPWIRDADEDDVIAAVDQEYLNSPNAALVARHNSTPSATPRGTVASRKGHPMSSGKMRSEKTSRWVSFARASAYPRENFDGEKVDAEWLNENFTDYSRPWLAGRDEEDPESSKYQAFQHKRQVWYKRAQFTILRNPFVPLGFRSAILVFAAAAMGMGASIYHEGNKVQACLSQPPTVRTTVCINLIGENQVGYYRDPSSLMAVIVDAVSIVYTFYITYDEYFSKPLGLRPARAKVRLVLLDLIFIVFQAANLSLAFEALTIGEGACVVGDTASSDWRFARLCNLAQGLCGVLTVSLVFWLLTFSVSILRLVERINAR